jgi:hypothetical protein
MTKKYPARRVFSRLAAAVFVVAAFNLEIQAKRSVFIPGRRAIVFDERFSALRAQPELNAPLVQRLRRGRVVGVIAATRHKSGARFLRVAISRNTQGWILSDAVARPGNASDAEKLMRLIEETNDDFTKTKLARLCADEYRATKFAPKALLILGESAERAAERLTRDARRRLGDEESTGGLGRRFYYLNFAGLDRYNRIGVTFDFDQTEDRIVYDGRAYRELLRRYPRSAEARTAREKSDGFVKK